LSEAHWVARVQSGAARGGSAHAVPAALGRAGGAACILTGGTSGPGGDWHPATPLGAFGPANAGIELASLPPQDAEYVAAGAKIGQTSDAFGRDIVLKVGSWHWI
jgi:hypothetical protein